MEEGGCPRKHVTDRCSIIHLFKKTQTRIPLTLSRETNGSFLFLKGSRVVSSLQARVPAHLVLMGWKEWAEDLSDLEEEAGRTSHEYDTC